MVMTKRGVLQRVKRVGAVPRGQARNPRLRKLKRRVAAELSRNPDNPIALRYQARLNSLGQPSYNADNSIAKSGAFANFTVDTQRARMRMGAKLPF